VVMLHAASVTALHRRYNVDTIADKERASSIVACVYLSRNYLSIYPWFVFYRNNPSIQYLLSHDNNKQLLQMLLQQSHE